MTFIREVIPPISATDIQSVVKQLNGILNIINRNFERMQQEEEQAKSITHNLMLGGQ